MKWARLFLITLLAFVVLALTPAERDFVTRARSYLQSAKAKVEEQQKVIQQTDSENAKLDQIAQGQQSQITTLSGQIDTAHANEQNAVDFNKYAKPIIDQVNSYWGLGAFLYGFKVLARHILILIAVLAVVAAIVLGLSIAFPFIGAFLRTSGEVIAAFIRKIGDLFRKK